MCGGHKNNVHIRENNVSLLFQARWYYLFLWQKGNVLRYVTLLYSSECKENVNAFYLYSQNTKELAVSRFIKGAHSRYHELFWPRNQITVKLKETWK